MNELTSKERVRRILQREEVDRVAVFEGFWGGIVENWKEHGYLDKNEDIHDHFQHDLRLAWTFTHTADIDFGEEILEETDETKLVRTGDGTVFRWWKNKPGTPEHVDFLIKERADWEKHAKGHLTNKDTLRKRIDFEGYRIEKQHAAEKQQFFCWGGPHIFELMKNLTGHENMLVGMALDPDWIRDMCEVYTSNLIDMMELLFAEEGKPDGIWFFEDMGFKQKPFMSPKMYRDLIFPSHKRSFDYAHSIGCPVIVHSCGFVDPLVADLIEAGMDCLQAMEVKAGMDLLDLKKRFGDRIALCGGLDVRALETNDKAKVEAELKNKVPAAMKGSGYILHTDHSISPSVDSEKYRFFVEKGREIGTYRK